MTDDIYAVHALLIKMPDDISSEVIIFHDGKYKPYAIDIMANNDLRAQKSVPNHALFEISDRYFNKKQIFVTFIHK